MAENMTLSMAMWLDEDSPKDIHVGFRGRFEILSKADVRIQVLASCPFRLYLNGQWIQEGPVRWAVHAPEYQEIGVSLGAGSHVLALDGHYEGVSTRMMEAQRPFVDCQVLLGSTVIPIAWKASRLGGYSRETRRINPQLGWIDWCDTRKLLDRWIDPEYLDAEWNNPKAIQVDLPKPRISEIQYPLSRIHNLKPIAHGVLTEGFGYDEDDPAAQFFLRDLAAQHGPPQGVWRRYDLGRVRLGRPLISLDLPEGTAVEFAYSEALAHERVSPWITLSAGPSCNLDRFVARGGKQEFTPSTPKAGRFMEIHIVGDAKRVQFESEQFVERSYHENPEGSFKCSDKRLERIWATGVETYRACSEDSVIDNPTRERGEWIGDSLTVGLENAAVAYSDLKLLKKALRQAADCARADGLVAGLCPGTVAYLSTYACHWISAGWRMFELTGDFATLKDLHPAADRNMYAFLSKLTDNGLEGDLGWAFIDWGYVGSEGPSDMGLNLIYLGALRSMLLWCRALSKDASQHQECAERVELLVKQYLAREFGKAEPWKAIGLQRAVLALRAGLIEPDKISSCVQFIKQHYKSCFPNDPFAPHLADPATAQPRLITPFFSHFALSALWDHGEGDFVLDQYRSCWGWALDQGLTTWPEVFDLRWSHCHQWSGCPTWQLTRYVLGINPRQDLGPMTFDFKPEKTSLKSASGRIPIPGTSQLIYVSYATNRERAVWTIQTQTPIRLRSQDKILEIVGKHEFAPDSWGK